MLLLVGRARFIFLSVFFLILYFGEEPRAHRGSFRRPCQPDSGGLRWALFLVAVSDTSCVFSMLAPKKPLPWAIHGGFGCSILPKSVLCGVNSLPFVRAGRACFLRGAAGPASQRSSATLRCCSMWILVPLHLDAVLRFERISSHPGSFRINWALLAALGPGGEFRAWAGL